jgi:salicylate hydroxylase
VASPRSILIAGAGIGGLTAALAIARRGYRVVLLEQAEQLQETGAGIQLSPNASRVLIELGLAERLAGRVAVPEEVKVANARTGRVLARLPLGRSTEEHHGAPYWIIHRGDLQNALREAVGDNPDIALRLGTRVENFALDHDGITLAARASSFMITERGAALVGADGLWSRIRGALGHHEPPRFAGRIAWRTLVPADAVARELRVPAVRLWLGRGGHIVSYPVKGGRLINVVAIAGGDWRQAGWSALAEPNEVLARFDSRAWRGLPRELLGAADHWLKWALYDAPPLTGWGHGPVTLLGDAAHPMLPYLAQGAAMAIEDAAELAHAVGDAPDDLAAAMRLYEGRRLARTARAQRAARWNGMIYQMGGIAAWMRSFVFAAVSGQRLIARYDWLYGWKETD